MSVLSVGSALLGLSRLGEFGALSLLAFVCCGPALLLAVLLLRANGLCCLSNVVPECRVGCLIVVGWRRADVLDQGCVLHRRTQGTTISKDL